MKRRRCQTPPWQNGKRSSETTFVTDTLAAAMQKQCAEQRERCVFTSGSLLSGCALRFLRILFVVVPIICGSLAGWDLLKATPEYAALTALLALAAGLVPAVYAALKLDEHLPTTARLAGEYKDLEIVFADLQWSAR